MKIIHVCRKFLEGFAYQENELVEIQAAMGHDVTVITSASDDSSMYFDMSLITTTEAYAKEVADQKSFKIVKLPVNRKFNFRFWKFARLYETIESIRPDLIFFHESPMLSLGDLARYKKNNPKVKLVMDFHSDHYNSGRHFLSVNVLHKIIYRSAIRRTKDQVDIYYYLAPNIKKFAQEMYLIEDNKMKYLPRGANLEFIDYDHESEIRSRIRREFGIPPEATVIISGGKLDRIKMVHNLAAAFNELNDSNTHLILFGSIEKDYEQELNAAIAGNPRIHSLGWIGAKEVNDYYLASDIACFPGRHSVLWEQAVCCGLPLIIKDWYKGMHYLNVKDNAVLIEGSDVEFVLEALKALVYDKDRRKAMRENALSEGKHVFSYHRIAQSIIDDAS